MTSLYIVRHAHASDASDDSSRPLSPQGRRQIERVIRLLRGRPVPRPAEIWHSPLLRARETATLLSEGLGWKASFVELPGLEPEGDPRSLVSRIDAAGRTAAIVGHEPFLSALAAILLTGESWPPIVAMPKCGFLALDRINETPSAPWVVSWHLSPELFGEPIG